MSDPSDGPTAPHRSPATIGRQRPGNASSSHVPLRQPAEIMRLARLGEVRANRLSLHRRLFRARQLSAFKITRPLWRVNANGIGQALYSLQIEGQEYSLICNSIGGGLNAPGHWQVGFVLCQGVPHPDELEHLAHHATPRTGLGGSGSGWHTFGQICDALSRGEQPDPEEERDIFRINWIARLSQSDAHALSPPSGPEWLQEPLMAEMLLLWLARGFGFDLAEHIAAARAPGTAARLQLPIKRRIGLSITAGPEMQSYLLDNPELLHSWISRRELALALIRNRSRAASNEIAQFIAALWNARDTAAAQHHPDTPEDGVLLEELEHLIQRFNAASLATSKPWQLLLREISTASLQTQEILVAMLLEVHAELIEPLAELVDRPWPAEPDPNMRVGSLLRILRQDYAWALRPSLRTKENPAAPQPATGFDVVPQVQHFAAQLGQLHQQAELGPLLRRHPELRAIARRVQCIAARPFGEIRDDLSGPEAERRHLLRALLALCGAEDFDTDAADGLRASLFRGAPSPE